MVAIEFRVARQNHLGCQTMRRPIQYETKCLVEIDMLADMGQGPLFRFGIVEIRQPLQVRAQIVGVQAVLEDRPARGLCLSRLRSLMNICSISVRSVVNPTRYESRTSAATKTFAAPLT